jgi:hypothetical protein
MSQGSIIDFDPLTDSLELLGKFEYPGRSLSFWSTAIVPLPNGSLLSISAYHPVALYVSINSKVTFTYEDDVENAKKFIVGRESRRLYVLRPFLISPDESTKIALYHTGNGFSLYDVSAPSGIQPYIPMIDGPTMTNGIASYITDTDGLDKLVVVKDDGVNVMTPFVGGIMGQSTTGSDLNMIIARDSLEVRIGDTVSTSSVLFRTIYNNAQSGVFAGVSDANVIVNYVRESPIVTTPYQVTGGEPSNVFTIGQVSGVEQGMSGTNALFVGQLSEVIVFGGSDAASQNAAQYAANQDFYFTSTVNDYINENNLVN